MVIQSTPSKKGRPFTLPEMRIIEDNLGILSSKEIVKLVGRQKTTTYKYIKLVKKKRRIAARGEVMQGQFAEKILLVFRMIKALKEKPMDMKTIAKAFDLNPRTTHRYVNMIKGLGITVERDYNKKYFIASDNCPLCNQQHTTK